MVAAPWEERGTEHLIVKSLDFTKPLLFLKWKQLSEAPDTKSITLIAIDELGASKWWSPSEEIEAENTKKHWNPKENQTQILIGKQSSAKQHTYTSTSQRTKKWKSKLIKIAKRKRSTEHSQETEIRPQMASTSDASPWFWFWLLLRVRCLTGFYYRFRVLLETGLFKLLRVFSSFRRVYLGFFLIKRRYFFISKN